MVGCVVVHGVWSLNRCPGPHWARKTHLVLNNIEALIISRALTLSCTSQPAALLAGAVRSDERALEVLKLPHAEVKFGCEGIQRPCGNHTATGAAALGTCAWKLRALTAECMSAGVKKDWGAEDTKAGHAR